MAMSARGKSRHFAARPNFVTMGAWRRGRTAIWIYENRVAFPVAATTDFLAPDILNRCGRAVPRRNSRPRKDPLSPIFFPGPSASVNKRGTARRHHFSIFAFFVLRFSLAEFRFNFTPGCAGGSPAHPFRLAVMKRVDLTEATMRAGAAQPIAARAVFQGVPEGGGEARPA